MEQVRHLHLVFLRALNGRRIRRLHPKHAYMEGHGGLVARALT